MEEWRGGRAVWTGKIVILIWFAFGRGPDRPLQARPSAWDSLAGHTLVDHFASRVWRYCAGRGGGGGTGCPGGVDRKPGVCKTGLNVSIGSR